MTKKIAVHVTNEEQWNEVRDYYKAEYFDFSRSKDTYPDEELAIGNKIWCYLQYFQQRLDEYEILEFNEWQARIKRDNTEKIEVPQAVYDEFKSLLVVRGAAYGFMKAICSEKNVIPHMYSYFIESESIQDLRQRQLNLAKVIAGEAKFVPIQEEYYWQEKQGCWLAKIYDGIIVLYSGKGNADKLTETEIREKTSFDIDKLKKVSE